MRRLSNKINWEAVSQYQTLSEDFIRDFQDKVDWIKIFRYQHLSQSFLVEFQEHRKQTLV